MSERSSTEGQHSPAVPFPGGHTLQKPFLSLHSASIAGDRKETEPIAPCGCSEGGVAQSCAMDEKVAEVTCSEHRNQKYSVDAFASLRC